MAADRHHGLGRKDDDGKPSPLPSLDLRGVGERAVLQQRTGAPAHLLNARTMPSGSSWRWAPAAWFTWRLAQWDVGRRHRDERRHGPWKLGDLDGVARAKSELVTALPRFRRRRLGFRRSGGAHGLGRSCPVLSYGAEGSAECGGHVVLDNDLQPRFDCRRHGVPGRQARVVGSSKFRAPLAGARHCGVESLSRMWCPRRPPWVAPSHEVHRVPDGPVWSDCYNANPASTEAAPRSMALQAARRLAPRARPS
jgi:hypothetical protein